MKKNGLPRFTLLRRFKKERTGYFALFLIFFAIQLILKCPYSDDLVNCSSFQFYPLNYSMGFSSRMFIGSVLNLFYGDYLKDTTVFHFVFVFMLIMSALVSYILANAISSTSGDEKYGVIAAAFLFVSSPMSISYFFISLHFGRLEAYTFIIAMLMLLCLKRRALLPLIPVLCLAAMATHQIFIVLFMPLVGIALLYVTMKHNFDKRYTATFAVTCVVAVLSFVYFQYLSVMPFAQFSFTDANEMADYLNARTDIKIIPALLYIEYFSPLREWRSAAVVPAIESFWRENILPSLLTFLPIIVCFPAFWVKCLRRAETKLGRLIFLMCLCSPLTLIFSCWAAADWDRWFGAAALSQFSLLFFFITVRDGTVTELIRGVGRRLRRTPALWLVPCAWAMFIYSKLPFYLYDLVNTTNFGMSIYNLMSKDFFDLLS